MTDEPKPTFDVTYKRADGELIGDYGWVNELEWFEDGCYSPIELIEERWQRVAVRTFWKIPDVLYSCTKVTDCDEDAVAWEQQPDGKWVETCSEHRSLETP